MSGKNSAKAKSMARAEAARKGKKRPIRTIGVSIGMGFWGMAAGPARTLALYTLRGLDSLTRSFEHYRPGKDALAG